MAGLVIQFLSANDLPKKQNQHAKTVHQTMEKLIHCETSYMKDSLIIGTNKVDI